MRFAPVSSGTIEWKLERKATGSLKLIRSKHSDGRQEVLAKLRCCCWFLILYSNSFRILIQCVYWCIYNSCILFGSRLAFVCCFSVLFINFLFYCIFASGNIIIQNEYAQCTCSRQEEHWIQHWPCGQITFCPFRMDRIFMENSSLNCVRCRGPKHTCSNMIYCRLIW